MQQTVFHVRKNDIVQIQSGKERGKTGKVLRVIHKKGTVVVEKVNMVKRHTHPSAKGTGGIVEKEAPISASKVLLYADKARKGVRISHQISDGKKKRVNKKHGVEF